MTKRKRGGQVTHGMSKTPTYQTWLNMIARCKNKSNRDYKYYGARGIRICARWHRFDRFFADMGEKPQGLTLDRIKNNGHYSPANCRWADRKTQQNNTRWAKKITYKGKTKSESEWARYMGMTRVCLRRRLEYGWPIKEALTLPNQRGW